VSIAPCRSAEETYPLVRNWGTDNPLPIRTLRGPIAPRMAGAEAPPSFQTGPPGLPFDFCSHMEGLCADVISRCPSLYHVDMSRLQLAVTPARNNRRHGLQARVTPLRLHDGRLSRRRRGVIFQIQRYFVDGREMLYLVTFCLPRFLDLTFDEKFVTIFHELFHIGPSFNGDLRRHDGRYYQHTHSKKKYDCGMKEYVEAYLQSQPDSNLHGFLHHSFEELHERHGKVQGVMVPVPKLVPLIS